MVSAPAETAPAPEADAAVWACKPALSDTASAVSAARRQSDFENDFNMGNWENNMEKLNLDLNVREGAGATKPAVT